MKLRSFLRIAFVSAALSCAAHADYMISGTGTSGTLGSASEPWQFNGDGGAAVTSYLNNWGSAGVSQGPGTYSQTSPAYGLEVTFSGGGTIDPASIAIGNAAGCVGGTRGGTAFCTADANYTNIRSWDVFFEGPDTLYFLDQDAASPLTHGNLYFVNVFFDGATPAAFTGTILTTFTPMPPSAMPEPSTFCLLATGFLSLAALPGRRRPAIAQKDEE